MQPITELKDNMGNKFFSLFYNNEKKYLYVKWEGQTIADDIYAGSKQQINWAEANATSLGCIAIINDCRLLLGSLVDTTEWATNVWSPAMYKAGIHYNAIIQSTDVFSQLSLDAFEEMTAGSGHIINKIFDSIEKGEDWIASKYTQQTI